MWGFWLGDPELEIRSGDLCADEDCRRTRRNQEEAWTELNVGDIV